MSININKLKKRSISIAVFVFVLLAALKVMLDQGEQQVQEHFRNALQEKSKFAEQDLHMGQAYIEHQKEQFLVNLQLAESGRLSHFSSEYLQDYPDLKVFSQSDRLSNQLQSNITGIGSTRRLTEAMKNEISAAMTLALSSVVNNQNFAYIWTYYTSKNQFMVLAPYISVQDFRVKASNFTGEVWQQAEQESADLNKVYYSSLYKDSAGEGYMITLSYPVYHTEGLLGFLSVDLSINELKKALEVGIHQLQGDELTAEPYLVDKKGMEIASLEDPRVGYQIVSEEKLQLALTEMQEIDEGYLLSDRILQGKFYSLFVIDKGHYAVAVLQSIFEKVVIVLAFIFCLFLLYMLNKKLGKTKKMAGEDSLSKLSNRRTLMQLGAETVSRNQKAGNSTGCLLIDIDHFKKINDKHGHAIGDEAIAFVSKILKDSFRKGDITARYGGEEFVVILSEVTQNSLLFIAEKLRKEIEESKMAKHPIDITVSIGCALSENSVIKLSELIKLADVQLYRAKENGRNRVEFE